MGVVLRQFVDRVKDVVCQEKRMNEQFPLSRFAKPVIENKAIGRGVKTEDEMYDDDDRSLVSMFLLDD